MVVLLMRKNEGEAGGDVDGYKGDVRGYGGDIEGYGRYVECYGGEREVMEAMVDGEVEDDDREEPAEEGYGKMMKWMVMEVTVVEMIKKECSVVMVSEMEKGVAGKGGRNGGAMMVVAVMMVKEVVMEE
ncbi:hypothetical protein CRG98_039474 [Punica granatum]|uniref:Uncharacterized protein n=1 Tax=Punica granatum TaxID=22663 RepID=A0A2I0I7Y8_PUNGR|nr:hypothetical protein CRG98_039474 [Punica granatum]